jgi:hypothetical protein
MLTLNLPMIANAADMPPTGTHVAKRLKSPLITIVPNASHLLPHRSALNIFY